MSKIILILDDKAYTIVQTVQGKRIEPKPNIVLLQINTQFLIFIKQVKATNFYNIILQEEFQDFFSIQKVEDFNKANRIIIRELRYFLLQGGVQVNREGRKNSYEVVFKKVLDEEEQHTQTQIEIKALYSTRIMNSILDKRSVKYKTKRRRDYKVTKIKV